MGLALFAPRLLKGIVETLRDSNEETINVLFCAKNNIRDDLSDLLDENGLLVINLSERAVTDLVINANGLSFKTTIAGETMDLVFMAEDIMSIAIPIPGTSESYYYSLKDLDAHIDFLSGSVRSPCSNCALQDKLVFQSKNL